MLIMSCDAYRDLWTPFFTLFARHWPDCPFRIYLGAEKHACRHPGVTTLSSPRDGRDWGGRLRDYLMQLTPPYVIVMLDDFFLRRPTKSTQVLQCLAFARKVHAVQVRLIPRPGPTDLVGGEELVGACAVGLPYRLSSQAAIWSRMDLVKFAHAGESIWEFEHLGNERAMEYADGFYAVWRPVLKYEGVFAHHVVEKGKWFPHEKWIFGRRNVGCDFAARGTLSPAYLAAYHLAQMFDRVLFFFPWRVKKRIKMQVKRILAPLLGAQFKSMGGIAGKAEK
ncbi:MAG TPA: hypothetical protein VG838_07065 [Opitutaceae bacterium]|nr:hypothetical protein [Lacunisphaera sp.]HWA09191.1 hypothetical protein [Opitutaceae bacterium]